MHKTLKVCLLAMFIAACANNPNMQTPPKSMQEDFPFDLQGHRGCRGFMPENTIPAMLKALEIGVNTLEMDVVITADSQVVLSHEPYFNHQITTKPDGAPVLASEEKSLNIYQMEYAEVKTFDVGLKPHPRFPEQQKMAVAKPLLGDVFSAVKEWCKMHNKPLPWFNIETKSHPLGDHLYHPEPARFVRLLMEVIQQHGMEAHTIIQSFDFRTLQYLRQQHPAIPVAALIEGYDTLSFAAQIEKLGFQPEIYSPAHERVTPEMVAQCRERKIRLIPWTVNDPQEGERLKNMGVNGLITDYPGRVQ